MNPFTLAMAFTRWAEGGYTDDNGGPTNFGVTQTIYDAYRRSIGAAVRDVRLITPAEVSQVAWQVFWVPAHCGDLPIRLAVCQFDASFNSGEPEAVELLQRTLGITVDGDYGPATRAAVAANLENDAALAETYLENRWAFMEQICAHEPPTVRLNGYRNRITNLRAYLATIGG